MVDRKHQQRIYSAACRYALSGYVVLPASGKGVFIDGWPDYKRTTIAQADEWHRQGKWDNVALLLGEQSRSTVVIDFDGPKGYDDFCRLFPDLCNTYTVISGSGYGYHVYFRPSLLPESHQVMMLDDDRGNKYNIELRSSGKLIMLPPSLHKSGRYYTIYKRHPVSEITDLCRVEAWLESLSPKRKSQRGYEYDYSAINDHLLQQIAGQLQAGPHRIRGDWMVCACPNVSNHRHGDRNHSFGLNLRTGGGNCFVCGGMSNRKIADLLGIKER